MRAKIKEKKKKQIKRNKTVAIFISFLPVQQKHSSAVKNMRCKQTTAEVAAAAREYTFKNKQNVRIYFLLFLILSLSFLVGSSYFCLFICMYVKQAPICEIFC